MPDVDKIVAMAVAAIAEECGTEPKYVKVLSFKEVQKSSLEKYIEDHQIMYQKYQLEALSNE